ncbi:rhomboid protease ROM7, putative [Plasmodium malariae]|uniref:Rhomboid protease ROM7, putative n=1 Tax=Plasmodium malariae TaxID=5858 RepID=A0A1C3KZA0_PLAMA|nr:rhomboid protease ROM7, putative [Plasmodium malariae]
MRMNISTFFLILALFTRGNSCLYNKIRYKKKIKLFLNNKNILFKNECKVYHLKKGKIVMKINSSRGPISNLWHGIKAADIKLRNVGNFLHILTTSRIRNIIHNNFLYWSYLFNKCKLDRIIITVNVFLYLYLNRINKNEEKKIYFYKGSLVEAKDEQKSEKYKCNYHDIYKNKNYKTFFTSIFIHKNILHLYFNMSSLISIYKLISNIYSNSQIGTIFLLSGFLSNFLSYIYHLKQRKKNIFFNDFINQNYSSENISLHKDNKIICGSSSSIYSLYGMYLTHIISFYFKNNYIVNSSFLYNFIYSFLASLFLENVSHVNHVMGFLCGFFFSFLILLFYN